MKQTAVEWYAEQAMKLEIEVLHSKISTGQMLNKLSDVLEQAKEMEKWQIIDAQEDGFTDGCRYTTEFEQTLWYDGEQYYNETYKNEKND